MAPDGRSPPLFAPSNAANRPLRRPRSLYPPPAALAGVDRHAVLERLPGKASRSRQGDRIRIADPFPDPRGKPPSYLMLHTRRPSVGLPDRQGHLYRDFVKPVIFTGFFYRLLTVRERGHEPPRSNRKKAHRKRQYAVCSHVTGSACRLAGFSYMRKNDDGGRLFQRRGKR